MLPLTINPECNEGKHANCNGKAWDMDKEESCDCMCDCHLPEHKFMTEQEMVERFHKTFGAAVGIIPRAVPEELHALRIGLIEEEFTKELIPAITSGDIVETVDAAIDILFVTYGLLVTMGVDARPLFEEVYLSNMSKADDLGNPIISRGEELDGFPEGKVLKGPNYFKPNLKKLLEEQGWVQGDEDALNLHEERNKYPEVVVPAGLTGSMTFYRDDVLFSDKIRAVQEILNERTRVSGVYLHVESYGDIEYSEIRYRWYPKEEVIVAELMEEEDGDSIPSDSSDEEE